MSSYDEALFEDDEAYEAAEDDEAAEFNPLDPLGLFSGGGLFGGGGRRRPAPPTARGRNYFNPAMPTPFVPRTEFVSAMNKVRADVTKNGNAIKTVNTRLNALQTTTRAQGQALKKQNQINVRQSKQLAQVRADMKKAQDQALLMTILMQPKKTDETDVTVNGQSVRGHLHYEEPDSNPLMTYLLFSMMFGGGFGGGGGGMGDMLLPIILISSGGLKF